MSLTEAQIKTGLCNLSVIAKGCFASRHYKTYRDLSIIKAAAVAFLGADRHGSGKKVQSDLYMVTPDKNAEVPLALAVVGTQLARQLAASVPVLTHADDDQRQLIRDALDVRDRDWEALGDIDEACKRLIARFPRFSEEEIIEACTPFAPFKSVAGLSPRP